MFGRSSPPFFCRQTIVTTHVFLFFFSFSVSGFFFLVVVFFLCGEKGSSPHHQVELSSVLLCLSPTRNRWNNCQERLPHTHTKSWSCYFELLDRIWDIFKKQQLHYGTRKERECCSCVTRHTTNPFFFFLPKSRWNRSTSTALFTLIWPTNTQVIRTGLNRIIELPQNDCKKKKKKK